MTDRNLTASPPEAPTTPQEPPSTTGGPDTAEARPGSGEGHRGPLTTDGLLKLLGSLEETGLHLPPSIPFDEWMGMGMVLFGLERSIMWAIGDWWRYGEHRFGEKAFQAAPADYSIQTLRTAARVAEKFPPAPAEGDAPRGALTRRSDVSWTHHREVTSLPDEEAAALLEAAAPPPSDPEGAPRMSTRQLSHEVQRRKDNRKPEDEGATPEERLAGACARAEEDGADWIRVRAQDVRTLLAQVAAVRT